MSLNLMVDKNGSGDFTDIASALDSVNNGEAAVIYIKNGVYEEKLIIDKPDITLVGQDRVKTVITYSDSAFMVNEAGEQIGTFETATVHALPSAEGFQAYNLSIINAAGIGSIVGQATALYLDCDKAVVKDCVIKARQDTLLTAPMFLDIERDPSIYNRQIFKNCYIEGDVDFIFGGAAAVFEDCEIFSLNRAKGYPCYVTAACTTDSLKYGYVFRNCHIGGNAADGSVYLGRPWREHANVVFLDCDMGRCVSRKGFIKWNDTNRHETAFYAFHNCSGEGYDESSLVEWCRVLTDDEAAQYTDDNIFSGWKYKYMDYEDLI